ncbi:hypothetical protein Tco_0682058 [Tanacetum coccineum]|uniref:Uncharacterized protein n=1 Tax=Tanacetum coccineum TaxID=301880 RepID=A0ABQ4XQ39_9ASTR
MGLWYPKDSGFELTAFSDADHAGCLDTRKSTSRGIQFLGDKLVSWMSKKQNCTAMSSAEAESVGYLHKMYTKLAYMFTKALPEDRLSILSEGLNHSGDTTLVFHMTRLEILPVSSSNSTAVGDLRDSI